MTTIIYGLISSRDGEVRYVGKTVETLEQRLSRHLGKHYLKYNHYKCHWLKKELKDGYEISIVAIDEVPNEDWQFWERYWIQQFRAWGFRLTNTTDGGEGICGADIVRRRVKTRMKNVRQQHADDILKFNIQEYDGYATGSRICNHCQQPCHYKHKTLYLLLSSIRRAVTNNRKCPACLGQGQYESSKSLIKGGWNPKRGGNKETGNPFFGKKHKPESLQQAIATRKKTHNIPDVVQMTLDGEVVNTFATVREASRLTGVARSGIRGCCQNKPSYQTAGGFKWKYR